MCLALIAIEQHPLFPLVILSNRDEFYQRLSSPADFWAENQNIYSGRDLRSNGTWLGVNRTGHFSFVTNYRRPGQEKELAISRGCLVANYLIRSGNCSPIEYLEEIKFRSEEYNNFSLIVGAVGQIYYYSNVENEIKKLSPGLYGLSNHLLDTPWNKVSKLKERFYQLQREFLASTTSEQISELLFPLLTDKSLSPEHLLPETGIEPYMERLLSPIFIHISEHDYGTNQSTIVVFDRERITFSEKKFSSTAVQSQTIQKIPIESR